MWTPRRVLLLLGGILLFCGVYGFYSRFLGWLDGKPQLPQAFLQKESGEAMPAVIRTTSPTIERIKAAFGPDCLEQRSSVYPNQLEFKNAGNGTSTVLACGSPTNTAPTRVVLAPFSVAQFSAPKPAHLREKDESPSEITTFHSDKAILEFDRPVSGPADMAKAKLLRMELVSEPATDERLRLDGRSGTIHITHNQRFLDPSKFLVVRTVGPLFYRDAKNLDPKQNTGGPDIWTDAAIEIVNRQNLPRRVPTGPDHYRTFARPGDVETVQVDSNILRSPAAVFDVLEGRRLPPPTATAIGLKVFLEPPPQPGAAPKPSNGSAGALGGVKRVELIEKVLIHLWSESGQGVVTTADRKSNGPRPTPPAASVVVLGGHFHAMETIRKLDRALLQVDTLGKLAYDTERGTARFDVLPDGNPDLPNDVQVHRVLPIVAGTQRLFSQILELEFGRASPVGAEAGKPASTTVGFKKLRAWTESPNRFVTLSSESDRLEAYGQYLLHDREKETTSLRGLPLYAARSNEPRADGKPAGTHILTGGSREQAAILTLKPGPPPNRAVTATVDGPGRIELYDAGAQANTIHATWLTQMSVTQEAVNPRRTLDLFTFIDGATFEDKKSEFWLKGKELRLWMEPKDEFQQVQGAAGTGRMQPNRVQALGNVTSRSADLDIEQADSLNVLFRDGVAPPLPPAPPVVKVAAKPVSGPMVAHPPPAPAEPAKPKPPMKLRARTVDTWMVRYPLPGGGADANMKYDMDKAVCEGRVHVTQDSTDPGPGKTGLRVTGETLLVDHTPDGSVLTVSGLDDPHPGEVHHDGLSIIGAKVVLNQINNTADVAGRGSLVLPATSNLSGGELKQTVPVIVHWRDSMKFTGASRLAEFYGKVSARQNDSFVICHTMQVRMDKPVDFSRRAPAGWKNDAKIESVRCYPAAEDQKDEPKDAYWVTFEDQSFDASGKLVKRQRLVARELEMTAKAFEAGGRDPHQRVVAAGPGTIRILQSGLKDEGGPAAAPKPNPNPGTPTTPTSDWKLTIVQFAGRMTGRDFGNIYQDATFTDAVDLMHVATDNIDAAPDRNKLPAGSVRLTCAERLIVSTHKKPTGIVQRLDGFGNVDIRSDQYDGWGETVSAEGPLVTLRGGDNTAASIRGRSDGNRTSGQVLTYNRVTGAFNTTGSTGGSFQSAPK